MTEQARTYRVSLSQVRLNPVWTTYGPTMR